MREVMSTGFLVIRRQPEVSFLLLRHPDRWDLPKGHLDPGETPAECALRELEEETGIGQEDISIAEDFEFRLVYPVLDRQQPSEIAEKTLLVYLAWLEHPVEVKVSEHDSYRWLTWNPPHRIQQQTIDPLLAYAETFLAGST
jgi:8-oxo-dGTP pyrophosphatase MutT (NUDIX family)